ncbi:MAG: glucosylglycerate hydrolase [Propionibacteriaceae bacterium]
MRDAILEGAHRVLEKNDIGSMVKAGPALYPHQWSWDAAFVSVGLAHRSVTRAATEWHTILNAQWATGMFPHIVFTDTPGYFPGFDVWGTASAGARPHGQKTSGICQPPVHGLCLELVQQIGRAAGGSEAAAAEQLISLALPRLAAWHDWLARARDRTGLGVLEIHHGWESGMDNSPRFDTFYDRIEVSEPRSLPRTDLMIADSSERPTDQEYQRYLFLIDQMRSVHFDDDLVAQTVSFRCGDIFATACLALSADAVARMAEDAGDDELARTERARAERARAAVASSVDPVTGLCRDYDITMGAWVDVATIAGFSMLICGGDERAVARQREILLGERWMGHPANRWRLPGSVSPADPAYRPRQYWRGPTWPIMNWFFAHAAMLRGDRELAMLLRSEGLAQLSDLAFGEYYDPALGDPLGSRDQSWSAMAAIDWLVSDRWR